MTIACLLVPSLALACELEGRPALAEHPVALSDEHGQRVVDATPEAAARGVRAGMTLREATAYCPALTVLEPRPARVARALTRLADALGAVSPLVETPSLAAASAGDAALYADLRGTAALFPRAGDVEAAILAPLARRMEPSPLPLSTFVERGEKRARLLPSQTAAPPPSPPSPRAWSGAGMKAPRGPVTAAPPSAPRAAVAGVPAAFWPRLGIAETRFTAYAAARAAEPGGAHRIDGASEGNGAAAAALARLPAEWLPLPPEAIEHLRLLGLRTLGAFAALPRHAVEAQLGLAGGRAWLAARGEDDTPLHPYPFARERVVEHAQAEPPLVSREAVAHAAEQLLGRALRHPRVARRFVRVLRLRATTEDDRLWERVQTLKEPTGDRDRLWTVIHPLLERADYPGPVALLELELGDLTAESARQQSLFTERARRREQLDEMVRHLKVRYGESPVARMVCVEPWSRLPERRYALMDYEV
jgi:nucleotidyltransferase/DNA polymerase involved in DNA repair